MVPLFVAVQGWHQQLAEPCNGLHVLQSAQGRQEPAAPWLEAASVPTGAHPTGGWGFSWHKQGE